MSVYRVGMQEPHFPSISIDPSYLTPTTEISPTNRAGCQGTKCKAENIKIQKGEIRQGVLVTIKETQSFKYRHWYFFSPLLSD